jgi:2-dehydro-3-deoxygluconokinase
MNFTERGFGVRAALGCSDRGHTAISQLKPGEIDWEKIFGDEGARWFHTGGIFCALSESTPDVAKEAMECAKKHGTIISYDLNYRDSLWRSIGGQEKAQAVNRELAKYVDVMIGNEEDFTACLGYEVEGQDEHHSKLDVVNFEKMIRKAVADFPNFAVAATTLRNAKTASVNDWGAVCFTEGELYQATMRHDLDIFRPRRRRRFLRIGSDLRISHRGITRMGRELRCSSRSTRNDNPRRHDNGQLCGCAACNERRRRPRRAIILRPGRSCQYHLR